MKNMATGAGGGKQRPPEDGAVYAPKKKAPSKKK